MKNVKILKIGFICLLFMSGAGTFFWYNDFVKNEEEVLSQNVRLELLNNGGIEYVNAIPDDLPEVIPTYYFRVRNNVGVNIEFDLLIEDLDAEIVDDGCTSETTFSRSELDYELYKDNKLVRSGNLAEIFDNLLLEDKIEGVDTIDYALRIKINSSTKNTLDRHYHYVINVKENNEKN